MDERLKALLGQEPAWLRPGGPMADVVVSSRVRLARNVEHMAFPLQMSAATADELAAAASESFRSLGDAGPILDPRSFDGADADFVVERNLATRDLITAERPTVLFCKADGLSGVMVNEEDHFRIQGFAGGMDVAAAFERAQALEKHLSASFQFATSNQFGFLTSCPTNTGSGMRASLMLHLPALARAKAPMQRALHAARSASLAVRGVHGEGSRALGHFFQISNQRTLGESNADQLKAVSDFGEGICRHERNTREVFRKQESGGQALREDLVKALEVVRDCKALTTAQALEALSTLRLGALIDATDALGFVCSAERLLSLCFKLQPGHMQAHLGVLMLPEERDVARAQLVRRELGFPTN
ncbi:MAG: hypothetical protein QM477_03200 [Planctomycetota bacterium]